MRRIRSMDYLDYLCLSALDKEKLPEPTVSVFWVDIEGLEQLSNQSWLTWLRDDLNAGGKFTLNLGVFKYEQSGRSKSFTKSDAEELARDLLCRWPPATFDQYQGQIVAAIRRPMFEPFLVILEGLINVVFSNFEVVTVLQEYLASRPLADTMPNFICSRPALSDDELHAYKAQLMELARRRLSEMEIERLLKTELVKRGGYKHLRYQGKDYPLAILLGKRTADEDPAIECRLLCSDDALTTVPGGIAVPGRVIGWACHLGGDDFAVRPVAMAEVNVFATDAQS